MNKKQLAEMLDKGGIWNTEMDTPPEYDSLRSIWRDMLAAAPSAPQGGAEVCGWLDRYGDVWRNWEDIPHSRVADASPLFTAQPRTDAAQQGEVEYEFEVWRDDSMQAGGSTTDYADAKAEADHLARMYGQDGAVEVLIYEKRLLTTAPPSAPETEENVAADSYHYLTELLEPYVAREGSNPNGPFPASVVESFQMLLEHWEATQAPSAPAPVAGDAVANEWRNLVQSLVDHIVGETCLHENTHRGGAIWEICDDCGAQWADDRGGRPDFQWPEIVERANAALAQDRASQAAAPSAPVVDVGCTCHYLPPRDCPHPPHRAEPDCRQIAPVGVEAAKHWHSLYRKECQLRQDDAARYGQQIVELEALAQQPAADKLVATFRCETDGVVGTTNAKIHSVTRHDDGCIEVVIDHWPQQPAAVGDTRRLEWLIANKLLAHRLSDTGQWMVTTGDLSPAIDGGEYDTPREAIDAGIAALAGQQQGGGK